MADFEQAMAFVLPHEGGLSDNPNDRGGVTNFGISFAYLKTLGIAEADFDGDGDVDPDDVRGMTVEQAKNVYWTQWWQKFGYGQIAAQTVASKVIDMSIQFGPSAAHKILQRALCACHLPVKVDGVFGPKTLYTTNQAHSGILIVGLRSEMAGLYRVIVAKNPDQECFEDGWLERAYA